jgi:DNA-binding MarR family transcriptional regulator
MQGDPSDPVRHEAIFRAAEIRALTGKRLKSLPPLGWNRETLPDNSRLVHAANMELARRDVRLRYLPADFLSENGWMILLDLFVSEHELRLVSVGKAPERWNLSPATAARQVAALIEANLVTRLFDEVSNSPTSLRLTDIGKLYVKRVLALSA